MFNPNPPTGPEVSNMYAHARDAEVARRAEQHRKEVEDGGKPSAFARILRRLRRRS